MITRYGLSATEVEAVLAAAKVEAQRNEWAVTIAVVDDGGYLQGLLRLDNAPTFSAHMAPEKARSAALGRRESKKFEEVIAGGRVAFLSAPLLKGMIEGGVPLMHNNQVVCAVGVSGVKSEQDAQIARAGLAAIQL